MRTADVLTQWSLVAAGVLVLAAGGIAAYLERRSNRGL
jgi:hypothetical protein